MLKGVVVEGILAAVCRRSRRERLLSGLAVVEGASERNQGGLIDRTVRFRDVELRCAERREGRLERRRRSLRDDLLCVREPAIRARGSILESHFFSLREGRCRFVVLRTRDGQ